MRGNKAKPARFEDRVNKILAMLDDMDDIGREIDISDEQGDRIKKLITNRLNVVMKNIAGKSRPNKFTLEDNL